MIFHFPSYFIEYLLLYFIDDIECIDSFYFYQAFFKVFNGLARKDKAAEPQRGF
jgi:hypothetical protein